MKKFNKTLSFNSGIISLIDMPPAFFFSSTVVYYFRITNIKYLPIPASKYIKKYVFIRLFFIPDFRFNGSINGSHLLFSQLIDQVYRKDSVDDILTVAMSLTQQSAHNVSVCHG